MEPLEIRINDILEIDPGHKDPYATAILIAGIALDWAWNYRPEMSQEEADIIRRMRMTLAREDIATYRETSTPLTKS